MPWLLVIHVNVKLNGNIGDAHRSDNAAEHSAVYVTALCSALFFYRWTALEPQRCPSCGKVPLCTTVVLGKSKFQ